MTEEILRIDNTVSMLKDGYKTMNEKLQEIPIIRENVKVRTFYSLCVEELLKDLCSYRLYQKRRHVSRKTFSV